MYYFRLCKYNPDFRDENGAYLPDEWTCFSEIGRAFNGEIFTIDDYEKTESSHINSLQKIFTGESFSIRNIENHRKVKIPCKESEVISMKLFFECFQRILRNEFWAIFDFQNGSCFVSWDYYIKIRTTNDLSVETVNYIHNCGLFIEQMEPYEGLIEQFT